MRYQKPAWSVIFLALCNPALAEPATQDKSHAEIWNGFADRILALHQQLIDELDVERKTRSGGYSHLPDFYQEEAYYHQGKLISRVQRESETDDLHVIEVFIRDDQGRVVRDYTAAYLPEYHKAPTQTLLSFHAYNGDLHAFRSFDASGDLSVERCTGTLDGEPVELLVDLESIFQSAEIDEELQQSRVYRHCFDALPREPGKYLRPQGPSGRDTHEVGRR